MATTSSGEEGAASAQNMSVGQPTVITVPVNTRLLEKLNFSGGNLTVKWQRFSRTRSNYDSENLDRKKEQRTATLHTCIGPDALDVIDAMVFDTEDERKDPETILAKMEKAIRHIRGMCLTVEIKRQMNKWMPFTALWKLTKTCNCGALADPHIRAGMVVGINDNSARKKLPQTSKLTLSQCIDIRRSSETSARQLMAINQKDVCFVKEENRNPIDRKNPPLAPKPPKEPQGYRVVQILCRRIVLHGELRARTVVSLTILLFAVNNQRKKSCTWSLSRRMKSM